MHTCLALPLVLAALLGASAGPAVASPQARHLASSAPRAMVLTVDDGPSLAPAPRLGPGARHAALRSTLARHGITAVMYVTLNFGANRPEGLALARAWAEAGHLLGNHTVTHLDLHAETVTLAQYTAEIEACDAAIRALPGWRRWFRATFLNEGRDEAQRAGLLQFLAATGYRLAPVHLDSRDWFYAARVQAALLDPQAEAADLKAEFMAQLRARAQAVRSIAADPVVLLLHDNLLTALWLDDILALLQAEGYTFVHPDRAFAAPAAR